MKYTINKDSVTTDTTFGNLSVSTNEEEGYRPFQLFIASLAGCSGTLLRTILTKKRMDITHIELEADYVRNHDKANRIEEIHFTALVQTANTLTEKQAERISQLVLTNCGMIQSVISSMEITFSIQLVDD
ncbi:OsmC family protein [Rossellomorea marisflavi]|uniref:OsmC family protein n=1 Tax=Rossellomorea marisflavi TaxID=189381 RepID=UPI00203B5C4D|nr:OsmC family protein [Rossellomorea marisflavi]MCM2605614.1 OsmC family protein [Rossellomorea marisflavi]